MSITLANFHDGNAGFAARDDVMKRESPFDIRMKILEFRLASGLNYVSSSSHHHEVVEPSLLRRTLAIALKLVNRLWERRSLNTVRVKGRRLP